MRSASSPPPPPPPRPMLSFAPALRLPLPSHAATWRSSPLASTTTMRCGIASIATTVGAVLTLCTASAHAHALTAPAPPPSIAASAAQLSSPTSAKPWSSARNLPPIALTAPPSITSPPHPRPAHHHSIPQKAANFLRSHGLNDKLVVLLISALPVVELRGAIPVGFLLGLPALHTFLLAVLGNMLPIIPLLGLLRLHLVQRVAATVLQRARRKAESIANSTSQATALALFVAVPLPGTGAWTGCFVAFVLGMRFRTAFASLFVGVLSAAVIVTALCSMGTVGGGIAALLLLITGLLSLFNTFRRPSTSADDLPRLNGPANQTSE
eukprot:gb/GEZJ01002864.1/.p3 GENE.gb/GEZJ01002864.1/~~gb/GEZJ01002864.1/.p3  ORF type:complete len:325 (-),score=65.92 gb/GEZJ01002864.1/:1703-2677(-)